jgi:ribosome recycling factor
MTELKQKAQKTINFFKKEIDQLRTGRASPALVENIRVEVYNSKLTLKEVASITTPQPRLIQIEPWDKQIVADIEKAILSSDLGLTPQVQGKIIKIFLPPLDEEQRQRMIRILKQKKEQARQAIRRIRDDFIKKWRIKKQNREISEDEFFRQQEAIQKEVDQLMNEIDELTERKEKEILTI